ncbi:MAG: iron-containing alcohol dehydrogenase [Salinivirgaceae bacterium]|jgi:alcohol dehydrogenase|nr:iron-containing alcohol dehydrogenase [Salinivirgaceae bacterium]
MDNSKHTAVQLLKGFKGENYTFGLGVLEQLGEQVATLGSKVLVVADGIGQEWASPVLQKIEDNLKLNGIIVLGDFVAGAQPNAPREDVVRIAALIGKLQPNAVISIGGGSTIDATKAAIAWHGLAKTYPDMDTYFGMGQITEMLTAQNKKLIPHFAVMMAASSAAHLTKYSNITDMKTNQKMLIVDNSVVPTKALFDYSVSVSQPHALTIDGALDGISHALEVLMGISDELLEKAMPVCLTGIELIVTNLKTVVSDPENREAREAIGLGTDLGGYAIMIGGTNGAHLNSFSMTDILSHGRACALMNPYYVVFFAPAIEERLRRVGMIFKNAGYISVDLEKLKGRDLGLALANGMIALSKEIGFPTTLNEVPGFTDAHLIKCLGAAKNPKLESKLKNMPVPLVASQIDEYMGSVLHAAKGGDMSLIKNL